MTKIEKLTDDARRFMSTHSGHALDALRIIDAQAAVIERVRAWNRDRERTGCWQWQGLEDALAAAPDHTECVSGYVGEHGQCNDCGDMHPAAPEHTAPVCPVHGDECLGLGDDCRPMASGYPAEPQVRPGRHAQLRAAYRDLAAANAKVAELEQVREHLRSEVNAHRQAHRETASERDAAVARADAAERRHQGAEAVCVQQRAELALAEERVKAANARADAAESEKDRIVTYHCQQIHQSNVAVDRAESEAAALRARIQAVLALCRDVNERSTRDPNAVSIIAVRAALAQ